MKKNLFLLLAIVLFAGEQLTAQTAAGLEDYFQPKQMQKGDLLIGGSLGIGNYQIIRSIAIPGLLATRNNQLATGGISLKYFQSASRFFLLEARTRTVEYKAGVASYTKQDQSWHQPREVLVENLLVGKKLDLILSYGITAVKNNMQLFHLTAGLGLSVSDADFSNKQNSIRYYGTGNDTSTIVFTSIYELNRYSPIFNLTIGKDLRINNRLSLSANYRFITGFQTELKATTAVYGSDLQKDYEIHDHSFGESHAFEIGLQFDL